MGEINLRSVGHLDVKDGGDSARFTADHYNEDYSQYMYFIYNPCYGFNDTSGNLVDLAVCKIQYT